MVNVENLCKSLLNSVRKSCGIKSGKEFLPQNLVDKKGFSQVFTTSFHVFLNNGFLSVKCGVFHVFHIAYYYNY